ncbi:MAG: hypothetical protein PHT91_02525 [Candidatus Nanoarchaeia archaeon]|nr:hypothetical protein [Candidatus Nanoarchaeia archaeon]
MKRKINLNKIALALPFIMTLITSIFLFIRYLINIANQSLMMHVHAWFGLALLVIITHKIGKNYTLNKK